MAEFIASAGSETQSAVHREAYLQALPDAFICENIKAAEGDPILSEGIDNLGTEAAAWRIWCAFHAQ